MPMRTKWQKVLDNQLKTLYNNRCKVKRMKTAEQILIDLTESVNKERSATVDENIHAVGEAIKRARDKGFGSLRTPILAGGAIRDYVYGLTPQDYDVFLDVSDIPEDEQEDSVLLFGLRVIDELVNVEGSKFLALTDNTLRRLGADNPYEREDANVDPRWKNFYVFETGPFDERIQRIWNEDMNENAERANDQYRFIKLQFIGHNDARLSKEDPTEFVEYFDYELVRCLFDPEIMAYRLHDDFVRVVNSKTLTVKEEQTARRVYDWTSRFSWANIGQRLESPIKVVNEAPAKKSIFQVKSARYADIQGGLVNNLLQGLAPAAPIAVGDWINFGGEQVRILNEQEAVQGWVAVRDIPEMPPAVPVERLGPNNWWREDAPEPNVPIIDLEPEENDVAVAVNVAQDEFERAWGEEVIDNF